MAGAVTGIRDPRRQHLPWHLQILRAPEPRKHPLCGHGSMTHNHVASAQEQAIGEAAQETLPYSMRQATLSPEFLL